MNFTILRFDSIGSTNTEALEQARRGAAEGLVITARRQTSGRGRHGRVWISGEDAGLFASIVLRPRIDPRDYSLITLMTAVAVADLLRERYGVVPDIKWVNDVHVGGRKISGILAEVTEGSTGPAIVVGVGINLRDSNFPPEIAETATSVEAETGSAPSADDVLDGFLSFFGYFYQNFLESPSSVIGEWAARSSYHRGRRVRANVGNETIEGVTDGLEPNGALRIVTDSGEVRIIQAGEIERIR